MVFRLRERRNCPLEAISSFSALESVLRSWHCLCTRLQCVQTLNELFCSLLSLVRNPTPSQGPLRADGRGALLPHISNTCSPGLDCRTRDRASMAYSIWRLLMKLFSEVVLLSLMFAYQVTIPNYIIMSKLRWINTHSSMTYCVSASLGFSMAFIQCRRTRGRQIDGAGSQNMVERGHYGMPGVIHFTLRRSALGATQEAGSSQGGAQDRHMRCSRSRRQAGAAMSERLWTYYGLYPYVFIYNQSNIIRHGDVGID